MLVTFLRHAESEYNEKHILQGQIDCNLSAAGEAEAREKAKTFDTSVFDVCYSSPLKRAYNTARIMAPDMEILTDDRLKERGLGEIEGMVSCDETRYMLRNREACPPGAETPEQVEARITSFIEFLKKEYPGKRVLVVTHGGLIYALMHSLGLPPRTIKNLETWPLEI